jgi:hypothetical protein
MPFSYWYFKPEIKKHFQEKMSPVSKILDVGPGAGTYGKLLAPEFKLDAVEIFEPYIKEYNLKSIYNTVHIGDIRTFDVNPYDYIILGDVLEHLSVEDSHKVLEKMKSKKFLIAVPYLYSQGTQYGNIHETHHQPDLTEQLVIERFGLKKLYSNDKYGYFINY